MNHLVVTAGALALLLLAPAGQAQAQGDPKAATPTSEELPFSRLRKTRSGFIQKSEAGKKVYVDGRWDRAFGENVSFATPKGQKSPVRNGLLIVDRNDSSGVGRLLQGFLTRDLDSRNQLLVQGKSTVRVFGVVTPRAGGRDCQIVLYKVVKLLDDTARFRQAAASASRRGDADKLSTLHGQAKARAAAYSDEELTKVARDVLLEWARVKSRQLRNEDVAGWISLARTLETEGASDQAVELLGELHGKLTDGSRPQQQVAAELSRRGAVKDPSSGTWISEEELRLKEGFVTRGGVWVAREDAELQGAIEAELELQEGGIVPGRVNPTDCLNRAREGQLSRGQNQPEVRLAYLKRLSDLGRPIVGLGLPKSVQHRLGRSTSGAGQDVWTQWVLDDGEEGQTPTRVYFARGEVVSIKERGTPWPR